MDIDTDSERLNGGHTSTSTQPLVLDVVETYKMRGREKTRAVARLLHLAGSSTGDDISGLGSAEDDRRKAVHRKFVMIVSSVALATAACLRLAEVIRSSHVVIIFLLCCLFCNELLRVRYFQWKYATTHHKLRRLMERRRAAGLRRLESETTARRAEWSSPPASSTAAFLRLRSNTSATASPPIVNYRRLSVEAFEHLASFVGIRNNEGNFREAREVESWIVRQLLQSGVRYAIQMFRALTTRRLKASVYPCIRLRPRPRTLACALALSVLQDDSTAVHLLYASTYKFLMCVRFPVCILADDTIGQALRGPRAI